NSTASDIVVEANQTYYVTGLADAMTFSDIEHGESNIVAFNMTGDGNAPSSSILVSTSGTHDGIILLLSKDNISYNPTTTITVQNQSTETIYLDIQVDLGESPGTTDHEFNINLVNSQLQKDYTGVKAFVLTDNSWNITYEDNITINGVSGQNTVNENLLIFNSGNTPINFIFSLSGNITAFANLMDSAETVQPQENYTIQLNYTAPSENNYYFGNLTVDDSINPDKYIQIDFNSFVFELNVIDITAPSQALAGDTINSTVELKYGSNYITDNITYKMYVNSTECPLTSNITSGNNTNLSCQLPSMSDGMTYGLKIQSDYDGPDGLVQVVNTTYDAVYYRDLTAPSITFKNITGQFEVHTDGTINLTIEDNVQVDTVLAQISYPNSTLFDIIILANTSQENYTGTIPMPETIGIYTVTYIINDTTDNINSSATSTFEVYEWQTYEGFLTDLNNNSISASFIVRDPETQSTVASFAANSTGFYNATIKRKTYDLEMSFLNATIELSDVDFASLPTDFLDIDNPPTSQFGYSPATYVVKGFAVDTAMSASGNMTFSYTASDAVGRTEDNLYVYKCASWDYLNRNCDSVLTKVTGTSITRDKISNPRTVTVHGISGFSAYLLAEEQVLNQPVLQIPTSQILVVSDHNTTKDFTIPIQSRGAVDLTGIEFTCETGDVCTYFTVSGQSINLLESGADYDAPLNLTVPEYFTPGTYTGTVSVTSNSGSVYAQYKTLTLSVVVNEDNNFSYISNLTIAGLGGGTTGLFGTILLSNTGNEQSLFDLSTLASYLTLSPGSITVGKNNTDLINIYYTAPNTVGYYTDNISILSDSSISKNISFDI
ncbi:MAG: hypothetical protein GQ477_02820, partial [Nanohaloarchaea archaeon]|nr:hypothetical protein [Candidatus Nanohaloarchaea archaeon]